MGNSLFSDFWEAVNQEEIVAGVTEIIAGLSLALCPGGQDFQISRSID